MRANRSIFRFVCLSAIGIAASCATPTQHAPLTYQMTDHPDENRIELTYRNDTQNTMCLTASFWPNADGKLYQMSNRVALIVDGRRFPISEFNKGPCMVTEYACVARVVPGEEVTGSIPYREFSLPTDLRYRRKTLYFTPVAPACH